MKVAIAKSLLFFLLFIFLVYLGFWQINRGLQKKTLISRSLPLMEVRGFYLNDYNVLIDNQTQNRQVGYRLLTAFKAEQYDKVLLVDRGFIAGNIVRAILPTIEPIYGEQTINGYQGNIPTGILLKTDVLPKQNTWPLVLQRFDPELISLAIMAPVDNFVLTSNATKPEFKISSAKHFAYATQWFSFAIILMVYYLFILHRNSSSA